MSFVFQKLAAKEFFGLKTEVFFIKKDFIIQSSCLVKPAPFTIIQKTTGTESKCFAKFSYVFPRNKESII